MKAADSFNVRSGKGEKILFPEDKHTYILHKLLSLASSLNLIAPSAALHL